MTKFVPRPKLSKKARKELDAQKRTTWAFSPVTKKVESKKIYNRKKAAHVWKDDSSMSGFCCTGMVLWHLLLEFTFRGDAAKIQSSPLDSTIES